MSQVLVAPRVYSPIVFGAHQPDERPYRGGAGIAAFRGTEAAASEFTPEDFVASVTEVHAGGGIGLSRLDDGSLLRDAVIADPIGFLGEEHVRRFGARTMLLVKLLDTAERLFVHYHPDNAFAQTQLHTPLGKTEAWAIIGVADGVEGHAHLGFNREVSEAEAAHWAQAQDVESMLGAMNRIPLAVGDTLLVPAGLAHGISAGITLVELQQPSDLSILLEYQGFRGLGPADALLGLDLDTAIGGLDRRAWDPEQLAVLKSTRALAGGGSSLFPAVADEFFGAERFTVAGSRELEASFAILVIVDGTGSLESAAGALDLRRGMTVLVPHGLGQVTLTGQLEVIRALPPRA
ncbi:class I mannose-6-phosphate isomerase [Mycetocola saprophilus]|uniref:class I mannose-6-phosphate isomerase n=1 Tax=Mycetocola saprophilus TaxID=76636 RepID=UPI0005BA1CF5|nr:class I mannose-6-phosphate isomerase [Mycetocola saprophilus]